MTPRVFGIVVNAHAEVLRRDHRGRVWLAWHTAAFWRADNMPPLSDLMRPPKKAEARTASAQMSVLKALTVAAGGKIVERGDA